MNIRIGTRASDLALCQTRMVIQSLKAIDPSLTCEIIEIKTSGDKKQGTEKARFGDKKDWVYELELALLEKTVDLAVHSAKDVPGNTEPGLALLPVLTRATPFDIFIGKQDEKSSSTVRFADLGAGSVIGTSSLRRKAALTLHNSAFVIQEHRGNVPTRLRKLSESAELSGIILAAAGVERLELLKTDSYEIIDPKVMVPSCNQGILLSQFREDDAAIKNLLEKISSPELQAIFTGERTCAHALEGDCNSAIGVYAHIKENTLFVESSVYDPNGSREIRSSVSGSLNEAVQLGKKLSENLLGRGARDLLV